MPRTSPTVSPAEAEREQLEQWCSAGRLTSKLALRCRIVLAAAAGETNLQIGAPMIDVKTVALWRGRFIQSGPEGFGRSLQAVTSPPTRRARSKAIVQATLLSKPEEIAVELADGASPGREQIHDQYYLATT